MLPVGGRQAAAREDGMKGLIGGALAFALLFGHGSALAVAADSDAGDVRLAQAAPAPPVATAKKAVKKPPLAAVATPTPVPPPEILVLMMRASIIALDQANKTNNYTVMRALSGPGLQAHSAEELSTTFSILRDKAIDLSPVLVTRPRMTTEPAIAANGNLHLAATFPTKPLSIACIVDMQPVAGFWRLAGITINLVPAEPDAAAAQ